MKPIGMLLVEAVIVAVLLVLVFIFVSKFTKNTLYAVAASGALFHILCEFSGINEWYAKNYFKTTA